MDIPSPQPAVQPLPARTKDQGPRTKDQGARGKGQGASKDQGARGKGQGARGKDQGSRTKDQGPRTKKQGGRRLSSQPAAQPQPQPQPTVQPLPTSLPFLSMPCVDLSGPWLCGGRGCHPMTTVSCFLLGSEGLCDAMAIEWLYQVPWWQRVWMYCPKVCGRCADQSAAMEASDDEFVGMQKDDGHMHSTYMPRRTESLTASSSPPNANPPTVTGCVAHASDIVVYPLHPSFGIRDGCPHPCFLPIPWICNLSSHHPTLPPTRPPHTTPPLTPPHPTDPGLP